MNETDPSALTRWLRDRDPEAFRALFVRHAPMVYATCRRILPTDADAEEITQECFEALAVASAPPADRLGPWLHRVATNRSLKRIRTDVRRSQREQRYLRETSTSAEPEWNDVYRYVDEAIAELPEPQRVAVVARYLEADTLENIAQRLNISPRTVAYRAKRGVESIRAALKKRGIAIDSTVLAAMMTANLAAASPVPATLTAPLGKLAIAGRAAPDAFIPAKSIGGILAMKKAAVTVIAVVGAAVLLWAAANRNTDVPHVEVSRTQPALQTQTDLTNETQPATLEVIENPANVEENVSASREPIETQASHGAETVAAETEDEPASAYASLDGVVLDAESGRGLQDVGVTARSRGHERETQTDRAGRFAFAQLPPGDYVVASAVPEGYVFPAESNVVEVQLEADAQQSGVEFAYREGGAMEGHIRFGLELAANERFELSHNLGAGVPYVEHIKTDNEGFYRLSSLMPGGRTVHFRYIGGDTPSHKVPVIIDAGETAIVDVHFLAGTAVIEGFAYRDAETPVVAQVEAHYTEQTFYARSGADGYYALEGLPAGPVQIVGFAIEDTGGLAPVQRRMFALTLEEGDVARQDIWLSGTTVYCQVTGIPETNFEAYFVALNGVVDLSNFNVMMLGLLTRQRAALGEIAKDGSGTLANLEPGVYTIVAVSFPSNPTAIESLTGEALIDFIDNLAISTAEVLQIETPGEERWIDLAF